MANSWNFDGKPVLLFEVRERNTIFMMVTEFRGIARKEGKILNGETQEKKNSSLAQVVMAKYRWQKIFTVSQNWTSAFRRPFPFVITMPTHENCGTKNVWPFYKQVSYLLIRYYLIYPQKFRYRIWLLQKMKSWELLSCHSHILCALGLYFNEKTAKPGFVAACSVMSNLGILRFRSQVTMNHGECSNIECLMRYLRGCVKLWKYVTRWSKIS